MQFNEPEMAKNDFLSLSIFKLNEEAQKYISSLISKETLSEKEQHALDEILKECPHYFGAFGNDKASFLFGKFGDLEKTGCFDKERLHQERLNIIPNLSIWNTKEIQSAIEKYAEKHSDFAQLYYQKRLEETINHLIREWKNYLQIDLSFDECAALYTIVGWFKTKQDILELIPSYDKNNRIHNLFLSAAIKYSRFDIFEKLFTGKEKADIFGMLYNFYYYRLNRYNTNNENIAVLISTEEENIAFFKDYLQKILNQEPANMRDIQLFFPMMNNSDIAYFFRLMDQEQLNTLIDIIAEKASLFPVFDFISVEIVKNYRWANMGQFALNIFSHYCELITIKNADEALLLTKYWYRFVDLGTSEILRSDRFFDDHRILDVHILPFINDDGFLYNLLSIPQEMKMQEEDLVYFNIEWFAHWLSLYLVKGGKNIIDRAIKKLQNSKKTALPESVFALIRDLINDLVNKDKYCIDQRPQAIFLYMLFVSANSDNTENQEFCKKIYDHNGYAVCCHLYRVLYNKMHTAFDEIDFYSHLPFESSVLLGIVKKECLDDFDIVFSIIINKLIEKLGDTFEMREKAIHNFYSLVCSIIQPELQSPSQKNKNTNNDTITLKLGKKILNIFEIFYRRVEEEKDSNLELFTFLTFYSYFHRFPSIWTASFFSKGLEFFFPKYPENIQFIAGKCSKSLSVFSKNPLPEQCDCAFKMAWFLRYHTSFWKGLKPLFIAFRNSKQILLNQNLSPNHSLVSVIMSYFSSNDESKLKKLRQDMANDFADYLKPAKNPRQPENYTKAEREEQGFALNYLEPSPLWRYAYIRALVDLGVASDGRGHFFHETLKNVAENDPSEMVRKAAEKADKELNNGRRGSAHNNHRRALCEAFWWIRQAHALSLGAEIDAAESNKTRVQEWRDAD